MSVRRPEGPGHIYSSQMPPKAQLIETKTEKVANNTDVITGAYTSTQEKSRVFEDQTSMDHYLRGGALRIPV